MISISSAFPILPAQDSLYYELLALTAICGELPCACADRLTSSKSYRKKVVTSLTHDKLLRIFSKDHLRGYRLGIRGKRLLRERAPERFQFYLSGPLYLYRVASKEFHITDSESTGVLQRLIESNDLTLYGLSNAVTRHSQDVESYDRASELESIGYSILTMPPRQWSRINRAAA